MQMHASRIFWKILEHSNIPQNSRHFRASWKILLHFVWNILEYSGTFWILWDFLIPRCFANFWWEVHFVQCLLLTPISLNPTSAVPNWNILEWVKKDCSTIQFLRACGVDYRVVAVCMDRHHLLYILVRSDFFLEKYTYF